MMKEKSNLLQRIFAVFIVLSSYTNFAKCQSDKMLPNVATLPDCSDSKEHSIYNYIYVSTLDGTLYALNAAENGNIAWQLKTDGEMLKSTIQNRELTNSGQWVRMIPSLSGSLYKFDGESIDLVPISVDQLLTSSFKYSDDLTFAGGKETLTYGVSIPNGRILYRCSMQGCKNETSKGQNVEEDDDEENSSVLIIQKKIQTVHAIAPESGIERWNFSVGQHDVKFHKKRQCHHQRKYHLNLDIRVIVPEGIVYAVEKTPLSRDKRVLWKQKLSSPIIDVWKWQSGQLVAIKIFNSDQWTWASTIPFNQKPSVYIGMHNKQLYIQESIVMQNFVGVCNDKKISEALFSIPWQPYLIASSTAVEFSSQAPIDEDAQIDHDIANVATTSLAVLYSSKYINGNGFLLYSEQSNETHYPIDDKRKSNSQCNQELLPMLIESEEYEVIDELNDEEETPVQIIIVSLWYWWKEVIIISITTAVVVNVFAQRLFVGESIKNGYKEKIIVVERPVPMVSSNSSESSNEPFVKINAIESNNFMSRFITDFNLINCLGKGGFGLVFEAQNKIDECNYAIKVINLPNRPDSRYRVMREVKALAKLEHTNIVRYFNAWLEFPPHNWSIYNEVPLLNDIHSNNTLFSSSVSQSLPDKHLVLAESPNDSFITFKHSKSQAASYTSVKVEDNSIEETSDNSIQSERNQTNTRMFLYIQMQLCRRESLKDWMLCNTHRTRADVKDIFLQILSAVQYVHLQGLIHRDLKPSNIFFSMDGVIKVGDFGLCTDMADEQTTLITVDNSNNITSNPKHTIEVGTQLYMSPEQLKGLAYNYKVDIYSLGVIFFELLIPFATEMERYKTLTDLRSNIYPKNFACRYVQEYVLLQLMLSYEPSERPSTSAIQDAIMSKEPE